MAAAEVTIERIAAGGDGVGRAEGMAVFVPRTAPGDRARVRLERHKRFARGAVEELLIASPERVDPLCYHYRMDRCGGCQVQHLRYDAQLEAKRGIVRDALARIGRRTVDVPPVEPSAHEWRYRRKLTLAMRRTASGTWTIGLHRYDDPGAIFQLADCPITDEQVMVVWRQVMEARAHLPQAAELRAWIQLLGDDATVVVEGGHQWPRRAAFFEAVPAAAALWWRPTHRARMLVATRGDVDARRSASFLQVNLGVSERLHEHVMARARAHHPGVVVDAYAGSGATAVPLALDGARVTAIEMDRDAVAACAARLPDGSRALAGRVEDLLEGVLPADVVLVNPPRGGLHERVSAALQGAAPAPRAVIYVSCDPATLGRDLARLPRYRVASVRAYDMFPQTAHVETVCELVPDVAEDENR